MEEEEVDWRDVTPALYEKIRPVGGTLHHTVWGTFRAGDAVQSIWVALSLEPFDYADPFYGEINSGHNGEMTVECEGTLGTTTIQTIADLDQLEVSFAPGKEAVFGAFSNSLAVVATRVAWGAIGPAGVAFEMDYFLTNSDSYGGMTGTTDDHRSVGGRLRATLGVAGLGVDIKKPHSIKQVTASLDRRGYDISRTRLVQGDGGVPGHSTTYEVPILWEPSLRSRILARWQSIRSRW